MGGGFAGLNGAKVLGNAEEVAVTLIDSNNFHLFQPLLYQVAMAGLSPAEIAVPIRTLLAGYDNIKVLQETVLSCDLDRREIYTVSQAFSYDYLILACGARHTYFGHDEWEEYAPGLKTIEQATEIRRRVLTAYERAEREMDPEKKKKLLTFVVVGGGPTGVELVGAIGEMSRFTLARDFKNVDSRQTRVILMEAGPRLLPTFTEKHAERVMRDLHRLGVEVRTSCAVTRVDAGGADCGGGRVEAATVLWAAGIRASGLGKKLGAEVDAIGRIKVEADLSIRGHPEVFVAGDQAHFAHGTGTPLPALAPVALQQGRFIARNILRLCRGKPGRAFHYLDKGQMATVGRGRAIVEMGRLQLSGFIAWLAWIVVHIYYLTGFKNRFFVVLNWAWYFLTFKRGARLIVSKEWRFFSRRGECDRTSPARGEK